MKNISFDSIYHKCRNPGTSKHIQHDKSLIENPPEYYNIVQSLILGW